MNVKIEYLNDKCKIEYASSGAAALDVRANIPKTVEVWSGMSTKVPLGFKLHLPDGVAAILLPRSGLGCKQGIVLRNLTGLIDTDYREEVVACLTKLEGQTPSYINPHDRVAQIMFIDYHKVNLIEGEVVPNGRGGFGSTGIK